jgi:hypothetical protein
MSRARVELVSSLQPGPEVNLVELFTDDAANARMADAVARLLEPAFVSCFHFPGAPPTSYSGLGGLRQGWIDWLTPWTSYRSEIEDVIDLEERVVVIVRDYARSESDTPEVDFMGATIWTVGDDRVSRVDFYAGGRGEGLASVGLTAGR